MDWLTIILVVFGLSLFEIISSIDNAIINAEVLRTMSPRARKWFLIWGILIAVFVIRGLLPFAILWASNPSFSIGQVISAAMSSDPAVLKTIEESSHVLLVGGGTFLVFLFLHWLFLEPKHYGIETEKLIEKHGVWFYAAVSAVLATLVWISIKLNPMIAFGAVIGSTAFFITHGFKENAAQMEEKLKHKQKNGMSDISKLLYLEVIDATFSIDGVLGAFAFTLAIPLILIGNGIGAIVVRQLTIKGITEIKKYRYLKNGAMYSVGALGIVMLLEGFGIHIPVWVSPVITFAIVGYFFWKSVVYYKAHHRPHKTNAHHKNKKSKNRK